ncbi:MAG: glycerol-3-phosphate 1-O-acyltransferase PlsY, partial [Nitrospirae bacterium]|nr:glycerol-3-phosphate 1-O-acyltransferase PlsY [Nitrospirota bacterium]
MIITLLIFAFLCGSIPSGIIVAKIKGVDLRLVGSGNIGATNVLRGVGKIPALITLIADILKGVVPVLLGIHYKIGEPYIGLMAVSAVLGHDFSIFLKFKGGKGVATSLGVFFIYSPLVGLINVILWLASAVIFRYSSLSALIAFGF